MTKIKTLKTLTIVSAVALSGCSGPSSLNCMLALDFEKDHWCNGGPRQPMDPAVTAAILNSGLLAPRPIGQLNTYDPVGIGMVGRTPTQNYFVCSPYGCP